MSHCFVPTISVSNVSPTYHISEGAMPNRLAAEVKNHGMGLSYPIIGARDNKFKIVEQFMTLKFPGEERSRPWMVAYYPHSQIMGRQGGQYIGNAGLRREKAYILSRIPVRVPPWVRER